MENSIPQQATVLEVKCSEICIGTVTAALIPNNVVTGVTNGMAQSVVNNLRMTQLSNYPAVLCSQELKYNITPK